MSEQLNVSARLRPPDYAMAWLDTKLARRLSPKTIERYLEDLHEVKSNGLSDSQSIFVD